MQQTTVVPPSKPIVAAFDFDGTLTYRDSLLPFIRYCTGTSKTILHLCGVLPSLLRFGLGIYTRQQVKERLLEFSFGGESYSNLNKKSEQFANERIGKLVNSKALAKLQWHQQQGHRCVLLSATLDIYLIPWATKMGFQDLICSQLEVDGAGKITGKLLGLNCWGSEKVRRLQLLLGPKENYILYAYGDSRGDRELLSYADFPFYREFGQ